MDFTNELHYSTHVIFRPLDGFWDLKHEKRGSIRAATIIFITAAATSIVTSQYTGFIYNFVRTEELNLFSEIFGFVFPFFLWLVANWCVTSIMDGEGSFKDIYIFSCYAMVPFIILGVPFILLSNILAMEEAGILLVITSASTLWTGGLLFFGTLVTHQYSILKTVGVMLLILLTIAIILFLGLLFINVIQQMNTFVNILYGEIFVRN